MVEMDSRESGVSPGLSTGLNKEPLSSSAVILSV